MTYIPYIAYVVFALITGYIVAKSVYEELRQYGDKVDFESSVVITMSFLVFGAFWIVVLPLMLLARIVQKVLNR